VDLRSADTRRPRMAGCSCNPQRGVTCPWEPPKREKRREGAAPAENSVQKREAHLEQWFANRSQRFEKTAQPVPHERQSPAFQTNPCASHERQRVCAKLFDRSQILLGFGASLLRQGRGVRGMFDCIADNFPLWELLSGVPSGRDVALILGHSLLAIAEIACEPGLPSNQCGKLVGLPNRLVNAS